MTVSTLRFPLTLKHSTPTLCKIDMRCAISCLNWHIKDFGEIIWWDNSTLSICLLSVKPLRGLRQTQLRQAPGTGLSQCPSMLQTHLLTVALLHLVSVDWYSDKVALPDHDGSFTLSTSLDWEAPRRHRVKHISGIVVRLIPRRIKEGWGSSSTWMWVCHSVG